jgi:hypothetical protein
LAWKDAAGHAEYLIDEAEVRNFYGPKIGLIAHSHWWSVAKVEDELANPLGPLAGRTTNRIDLTKIACLLRISDAMHLDRRRAPAFLAKLLQPDGPSASHWAFQERMAAPFIDGEALVYSAAPAFELEKSEAWWLAFDSATMVDGELREVDHLLQRCGHGRLAANRVKGVSSPGDFARHVETVGWTPVDSTVRVTDVPKIVATLGGSKLYGNKPTAAVRELIQNGADAIDARRRLQKRESDWGKVTVSLERRDEGLWLMVEDTGVGMSTGVLTGPLIDFGNSFWRSPFAAEEFPGMQAAGVRATGRYGIGFFSVFMLGDRVRVITRRYDRGAETAKTLEFMHGLGSRPILYTPVTDDIPLEGGTRVEVLLSEEMLETFEFYDDDFSDDAPHTQLGLMIASVAPNLNVSLSVRSDGKTTQITTPEDWLSLPENPLIGRLRGRAPEAKGPKSSRLRQLVGDDGVIYGRASIGTSLFGSHGCISVGGLRASEAPFIRGILLGRESTASRNEAFALAPAPVLRAWATEQASLISKASLSGEDKALAAQIVLHCGGKIGRLPVARFKGEWINEAELRTHLRNASEKIILHIGSNVDYDEDEDDVHPREFNDHFQDAEDVIFVPSRIPGQYSKNGSIEALQLAEPLEGKENLFELVFETIYGLDQFDDCEDEFWPVGVVQGTEIVRPVKVFARI